MTLTPDALIDGDQLKTELAELAGGRGGDLSQNSRAAVVARLKQALAEGRAEAERALMADGRGTALRPPPVRPPGRDHPRHPRLRRRECLSRRESVLGRAHGHRRRRRLRPRHAGAGLGRRPPLSPALQADPVGRERRRVHPLHPLGSRPEGRPRHPQRRRMHPPVPLRHDHPHRGARGALHLGRHAASTTTWSPASTARWSRAPAPNSSPPSSPSATRATASRAPRATSSSRTSRKARAACAISTRSSGSPSISIASARARIWSRRASSRAPSSPASASARISSGRSAATCTS